MTSKCSAGRRVAALALKQWIGDQGVVDAKGGTVLPGFNESVADFIAFCRLANSEAADCSRQYWIRLAT